MLLDLTHSLQLHPTKAHVLWELSNCISSAVGADSFRLYLTENGNPDALNLYIGHDLMDNGEPKMQKIKCDIHSIPTYVARTREPIRLSKEDQDPRFPDSFVNGVCNNKSHYWCFSIIWMKIRSDRVYSFFFCFQLFFSRAFVG